MQDESAPAKYAKGLGCWYQDRLEDAVREYNECISELATPIVHFARALALSRLGKRHEANQDLTSVHELAPWLVAPRAELAREAFGARDYTTVCEVGELAPELRDDAVAYEPDGWYYLAELDGFVVRAQLEQGEDPRERIDVASGSAKSSNSATFGFAVAIHDAERGATGEAEALLKPIVEVDTVNNLQVTQRESAILLGLVRSLPRSPWMQLTREILQGSEQGGDDLVERVIDLAEDNADDVRIWTWVARRSIREGRVKIATAAFERLRDQRTDCKHTLGTVCLLHARTQDVEQLKILADAHPSEVLPWLYLRDLSINMEDDQLARKADCEIAKIKPGRVDVRAGVRLYWDGMISLETLVSVVCERDPLDFEGRSLGASVMFRAGLYEKSRIVLEELFADGFNEVGWLLEYALICVAEHTP